MKSQSVLLRLLSSGMQTTNCLRTSIQISNVYSHNICMGHFHRVYIHILHLIHLRSNDGRYMGTQLARVRQQQQALFRPVFLKVCGAPGCIPGGGASHPGEKGGGGGD